MRLLRRIAFIAGLAIACTVHPALSQSWTGGPTGPVYYNGGNVGIGTTSPHVALDVAGAGDDTLAGFDNVMIYNNAGTPRIQWEDAGYNRWIVDNWTGDLRFILMPATNGAALAVPFYLSSTGNTIVNSGNVGIGTTSPQYKLSVNGTIGAKEVIVTTTGWSDYVFQPTYRLRPLSEVAAYIKVNHHLPEIPAAAEVAKKGVSVGEMQAKLLAKIEELTLHMIRADERNQRLEEQNRELQERMARLEKDDR